MVYYNMMYGYGFSGLIFMIAFWAVIIWLVVWAVKQFTYHKESATEILSKEYAKGKINKKEYLEKIKTLKGGK